jgi:hypothetical protein
MVQQQINIRWLFSSAGSNQVGIERKEQATAPELFTFDFPENFHYAPYSSVAFLVLPFLFDFRAPVVCANTC